MKFDDLGFEIQDGVAIITLNRPDKLNSFNNSMGSNLQTALDHCMENAEIRCVLLTGSGRGFCAGQDLEEAVSGVSEIEEHVENKYNPLVRKIRAIEKPVIAAVNGVAAGAGANLAYCCDIVLATESAKFIQSFVNIGLIPDTGGTFFLPRLVGIHRASVMMMLGEKVSAEEAKDLGLVYKVFPDGELMNGALELAKRMAQMPTRGIGLTKKALNYSLQNTLNEQLAVERDLQGMAGLTSDNAEGINAFLEKRKPVFKGE
ncbi:MAG: 2-(1,2-epoxy-1,2-dihydrophenyl)acetyl-CoA isomerase [Flavobacteriales bacterium]|nr:2-(1,2-epoxy-1,2-dihydrophenyl)acetyl-CoA isomerase [Flavobacteriales bacterium]MCB9205259.1 2-(1,2-epoxy-1,2-dihydrophenyl)acetyl-CoA isomerase [Flavobacteriales bacterium]